MPPKRSPPPATSRNGRCLTWWPRWSTRAWSRPRSIHGSTRYRLLETVRHYAAERLALRAGSGLHDARVAHRDHYLALVETASARLRGPDEAAWLDRLEAEFDNIRAALAFSIADPGSAEPGLRLVSGLQDVRYCAGTAARSSRRSTPCSSAPMPASRLATVAGR